MTAKGWRASRDRERLRRLAAGDLDALAELYDEHGKGLYGHALWITRSREDAEDVVQNALLRLAGMGDELVGIRQPRAFLYRMVHHSAVDVLRARGSRKESPMEEALLVAWQGSLDKIIEARQLERRIHALNPPQREALFLHLHAGLTFREVGRVTGVSTFTAASRYRLALEKLRREVGTDEAAG
jgi:RNA polymerase sigma-70 factor, ECF subfamily